MERAIIERANENCKALGEDSTVRGVARALDISEVGVIILIRSYNLPYRILHKVVTIKGSDVRVFLAKHPKLIMSLQAVK